MSFGQAITLGFRRYVAFHGRSARWEYWYWTLFVLLLSLGLGVLDVAIFGDSYQTVAPLQAIGGIVTLLPNISISVRRLHDIGRSGWWLLLIFVPLIGMIVLLIWFATRGNAGPNRYGPDPLLGIGEGVSVAA